MRITKLANLVALCAGSSLLVACGGSSSQQTTTHRADVAQHPRQTLAASGLDTGGGGGQQSAPATASGSSGAGRPDVGTHGASPTQAKQGTVSRRHSVQRGRTNPVQSGDDHNPVRATGPNPCRLVSLGEARSITGGAIATSTEAPLGPTCVYKLTGSKSDITLDVESTTSVSQATGHMAKRQRVTIRGHQGYCGTLGTSMLYLPFGNGQLLHVTAPCGVAHRFAALALGRLAA